MKRFLVFALCAVSWSAAEDFTCSKTDPKEVRFYGNILTCPDKLVCNSKNKTTGTAKPKPCIDPSILCEYTCNAKNETEVTINAVQFKCDVGQKCNAQKTSCDVCVPIVCDKTAWTCNGNEFDVGGWKGQCGRDICNSDHVYPCTPCIKRDGSAPLSKISKRSIRFTAFYA